MDYARTRVRAHNLAGSARIGDEAATERTNDRSKIVVNVEKAVREIHGRSLIDRESHFILRSCLLGSGSSSVDLIFQNADVCFATKKEEISHPQLTVEDPLIQFVEIRF